MWYRDTYRGIAGIAQHYYRLLPKLDYNKGYSRWTLFPLYRASDSCLMLDYVRVINFRIIIIIIIIIIIFIVAGN